MSELKSGRYDKGFNAGWFHKVLQDYQDPVKSLELASPKLIDKEKWSFSKFRNPATRLWQSKLEYRALSQLELSIDSSGQVTAANVVSGHPLLKESAAVAVKDWIFDRAELHTDTVPVTIEYSLACEIH